MSFTRILYDPAMHPECVRELRREVRAAIDEYQWTKAAMGKMTKADSCIKESMRLAGIDVWSMHRQTVKGFTFSSGLYVPAKTSVGVPIYAMHHDENLYTHPEESSPFRFSEMYDASSDGESAKHQMVSLSLSYIAFGNGRHACPGGFFATNELGAMLTFILLNFNVKLPTRMRPENIWFQQHILPNTEANIMFRRR